MRDRIALTIGSVVLIVAVVFGPARGGYCQRPADKDYRADIRAREQELAEIRQQLAEKRQLAGRLRGKESGVLLELQHTDEKISLAERLLSRLKAKESDTEQEIASTEEQVTALTLEADRKRTVLARRLREVYKQRLYYQLEVLLSARSLSDLAKRYKLLQLVAENDRRLYVGILDRKQHIEEQERFLKGRMDEVALLRREKEREKAEMKTDREKRAEILRKIRQERAAHEQALRELEAASKRIQELIDRLERERRGLGPPSPGAAYFQQHKGALLWPTQGSLLRRFGPHVDPITKTTTLNKGIDIKAPYGAEIRAVGPGRVVYLSTERGYGKFVFIDHGNGYRTIYAHAADIFVSEGQNVEAGQVIGLVGDGGSFEGAKLHFEIRKGRAAVDPLEWLR